MAPFAAAIASSSSASSSVVARPRAALEAGAAYVSDLIGCAAFERNRAQPVLVALLTVAAFWSASRRRFLPAYLLLAAGALLKLYPIALVPVLMIEHRRFLMTHDRPWRKPVALGAGAVGGLVAASFAVGFLLEGWNSLSTYYYAAARPLQVESLGATLLWFGSFFGFPAVTEHG